MSRLRAGAGRAGQGLSSASSEPAHRPLLPQALERLVSKAIRIQIECLQELLQYEVQATFDILDLRLQKKTMSLNAPVPFPPITGSVGREDSHQKPNKGNKGKKAKAKK